MKRKRLIPLTVAVALALGALAGCASGASSSSDTSARSGGSSALDSAQMTAEMSPDLATEAVTDAGQHIISTAEVHLQAQQPEEAASQVDEIVTQLDGTVESLTVHKSTGDSPAGAELSVRVPPKNVDAAIEAFDEIGDVTSQSRSAQDVTSEYVDLEARIKALETSVKRLNDLMAGAATTSELIEAEGALTERQQELDGLRAQFKALDAQVSDATIWISITSPSVLPGGGPGSFWEGLKAGFSSLGAAASGALVVLGVTLPWLAIAGAITLAVVFTVRSRRRRRARDVPPVDQTPMPL